MTDLDRTGQGYTIERFQTHCYILLRDRVPVGRLERLRQPMKRGARWQAFLDPTGDEHPAPFTAASHVFPTFAAASAWLGLPY